jgi:alkyl sulfatase BDS1-like metallo-beta-lactamase superfamily hydrolase
MKITPTAKGERIMKTPKKEMLAELAKRGMLKLLGFVFAWRRRNLLSSNDLLILWAIVLLLSVSWAGGQILPNPATDITAAHNASMYQVLDFNDQRDFEDANRGFIAGLEPPRIIYNDIPQLNQMGFFAWNLEGYQFMTDYPEAPPSANPSLWRQESLNNINGLFMVIQDCIYQVRSYELATMSFIRTTNGWIVVDPLTSGETSRAGLALLRAHVSDAPVVAIISTHSHLDHYGGIHGILQAEGKSITPAENGGSSTGTIPFYAPDGFYMESLSENLYLGNSMFGGPTTCMAAICPKAYWVTSDRGWAKLPASVRRGSIRPRPRSNRTALS